MAQTTDFFQQKVADYLLTLRNQITIVAYVGIFSVLFINIFQPYALPDLVRWNSPFAYFVWSVVLTSFGLVIMGIGRALFFLYMKRHEVTNVIYGLWIAMEWMVIAIICAVCFFCLSSDKSDFMNHLLTALWKVAISLLIPYAIALLAFALRDKNSKLRQMAEDLDSATVQKASSKNIIPFYDERGELQLSLAKENFLYIESAENYVVIWYLKNNLPRKQMMRMTMQRMAEQLQGTAVMRCHRSYLVNMDQVKVLRREKEGFFVEMGISGVPDLPVSKTYSDAILKWLSM